MPPTVSVAPSSSVLMNFGANVPGAGDPCLPAGELTLFELLRTKDPIPISASELVRECDDAGALGMGDCMMADFDRACPGGGPGDGVPFDLPKGLFRQRGPFCCACEAISSRLEAECELALLLSIGDLPRHYTKSNDECKKSKEVGGGDN